MTNVMRPVLVTPMHDPHGLYFPHLFAITPDLKALFARAFVAVTPVTRANCGAWVDQLVADDFFDVLEHQTSLSVGDDLLLLYARAAAACPSETVLHLCFIDRVAFALQNGCRHQFMADLQTLQPTDTPLIFHRSAVAWQTHPSNYRQLEQMVTQVGEMLLQKSLDFAWCHLALQARHLQAILPHSKRHDFSICAEFVLLLRETIQTREVDWLAWEDPFLYRRDPEELRREREQSIAEVQKRLAYVLPMLQVLHETAHVILHP